MNLLEIGHGNELAFLIIGIFALWFLPPVIFLILGLVNLRKNKNFSKGMFILAIVYFLVGLGFCTGSL